MDNLRLILIFALAFVLLLLYQAWVKDYGAPPFLTPSPRSRKPRHAPSGQTRCLPHPCRPSKRRRYPRKPNVCTAATGLPRNPRWCGSAPTYWTWRYPPGVAT